MCTPRESKPLLLEEDLHEGFITHTWRNYLKKYCSEFIWPTSQRADLINVRALGQSSPLFRNIDQALS